MARRVAEEAWTPALAGESGVGGRFASMEDRPPPLTGITVLDFGQVYQGPYAGLLLAKAGADVIKIEPPRGEPLRIREAVGGGASLPLAMLNSNKRAITLNLKSQKAWRCSNGWSP